MSSPVTPFLKNLIKRLLSHSERYESSIQSGGNPMIEALPLMDRLESVVQNSIESKTRTHQIAKRLQEQFGQTIAPTPVQVSIPSQYEPALRDEKIVQALLHLQRKRPTPRL